MSPRHLALGLGLLAALWLVFAGDAPAQPSPTGVVAADKRLPMPAASSTSPRSPTAPAEEAVLALQPRAALMQASAKPRNPFAVPTPPAPPAAAASAPLPPPPPQAPPLPFQFVGKQYDGQAWSVFLEANGQTVIAQLGDTLLNQYRVDAIGASELQFTYLPLQQRQLLAIGQGQE